MFDLFGSLSCATIVAIKTIAVHVSDEDKKEKRRESNRFPQEKALPKPSKHQEPMSEENTRGREEARKVFVEKTGNTMRVREEEA
ncbi:hypothetical protein KSF_086470 [Reticulibacter mediterranei]|uniref:Uncharacterized protein n=1 Tax=Reticulibacter mediterranei TaxID=2778369 RepID=A0A8J3IVG5_9CHLR|nr:hypothetical protein KSF_086470 [Reticulibacter mediterranei]